MNAVMNDIRDVRPPVDVPGISWIVWLILLLALVAVALYFLWQRYQKRMPAPSVPKTSWGVAYERLGELERADLYGRGQVKEYFIALSDIVRRYIEDRFNIHAPEMTTEEFLNSLKANPFIADNQKNTLKKFLSLSDMVKFAKYGSTASEARESLDLAKRFVDETKVEEAAPKAAGS